MIELMCSTCNKKFFVRPYRKSTARFCSRGCNSTYHFPERKKYFQYDRHGKNHWNWKGGKKLNSQGYLLVYSPNHPFQDNQGYVREHRLVMEDKIGRYLSRTETIHHVNGNKIDNRIENLALYESDAQHLSENHGLIRRGTHKECLWCKEKFYVPRGEVKRRKCCSVSCSINFRWKSGKQNFGK